MQEGAHRRFCVERGKIMMWGNDCWSGWGHSMGIAGILMMLVFWALIITAIVMFVDWVRKRKFPGRGETPLDILKRRYAQGEIGKDDFDRMKKDLQS
jgi:putative membrane protein